VKKLLWETSVWAMRRIYKLFAENGGLIDSVTLSRPLHWTSSGLVLWKSTDDAARNAAVDGCHGKT